ncbi:MAG: glycosyltransferase, partial [Caldithrix sp.]|nr:glycosyltransferase [Caldithrix sp.]
QSVISYIHFPRKARFKNAELKLKKNLKQIVFDLEKILARGLYHTEKMDGLKIIANSNFTKKIIGQQFKISESQIEVIYPPVNIEAFFNSTQKKKQVVSIGRFMPDKLQLQQIQISKSIPYLDFHLIGFVSDSKESLKYFDECRNYIAENNLKNVYLHPNYKFGKMKQIIFQSKYYLHMLEDEPFGITTVQAIAAGCIPIVPNSGGQIEIVPIEQLRWDNIQQIADIFNKIENTNIDHYKKELQFHIKQFGNEQFSKKFLKIFDLFGIDDKGGK